MSFQAAPGSDTAHRDYLDGLALHGIKLGLDKIRGLLEAAGNPHDAYPSVHIAGTNGKGSVVAFLHAMFAHAGYRVGCFTSPHLIDLTERFQVGNEAIPEEELCENIKFFQQASEGFEHPPTYFELCTAIAFRWFQQRQVDLALVEVGMGGRLDSTNVLTPVATAVTNIDLEHTMHLGDTLEEIAFEKAGILKEGVPAVIGETKPGARQVILDRARQVGADVMAVDANFSYEASGEVWRPRLRYRGPGIELADQPLGLAGRHQASNAAVAVALAESLRPHFPRLRDDEVQAGLRDAKWPCRMERVLETPPVIIDVAHNVAGTRILTAGIDDCVAVVAVASDKDAAGMLQILGAVSSELILTSFPGDRALPLDALCAAAGDLSYRAEGSLQEAIALGMTLAREDCPLLITGSIFTAGEARRILIEDYAAPGLSF